MVATSPTENTSDQNDEGAIKQKIRLTALQWRILLLLLLLFIVDGIDMQMLGVTVSAISMDWDLPLSAFSTAMAAGHAGAALGAVIGGVSGDRFGRRTVMVAGALFFGALTLCIVLATNPYQLVIIRFLAGLGLGACLPPGLAMLAECMPPRFRSFAVSLAILCAPLGIASAGFLASAFLPTQGWEMLFIIAGVLPLVVAVALWLALPESPAFLLRFADRRAEAEQLIERLNLKDEVTAATAKRSSNSTGIASLIGEGQVTKSLCLFGIFFVCYLSMSMVLSWLPALLSNAGFGETVSGTSLATWSLTGMAGVFFAGVLMSRFGTRKIVGAFLIGSILALSAVAIALPKPGDGATLTMFYILIAVGGFALNGSMTTIFAHAAHIFPSNIRSTGIGVSATSGRIGAISGAFVGAYMLEWTGANGFFAVVAGALLFAFALYLLELWVSSKSAPIPVS